MMTSKPKPPASKVGKTPGGKPAGKGRTRFVKSGKPGKIGGDRDHRGGDPYGTGDGKPYRPGVG